MGVSSVEYVAYIGLDWADREHAWCLQVVGNKDREKGALPHTPEAVEQWAAGLAQMFPGAQIAIALEQSRGALLFALTKYGHLTLYPVHHARVAHYRKSFRPSGAKDDPTDAELLLSPRSRGGLQLGTDADCGHRQQPNTASARRRSVARAPRRYGDPVSSGGSNDH